MVGACMAGGHAFQGGVHGRGVGVCGRGACMAGGVHGTGRACVVGGHAWHSGACVADTTRYGQ